MLGPEVLGETVGTPANEEGEGDTGTHVCNVSCMQTGKSMRHHGTYSIPWRVTRGSLTLRWVPRERLDSLMGCLDAMGSTHTYFPAGRAAF